MSLGPKKGCGGLKLPRKPRQRPSPPYPCGMWSMAPLWEKIRKIGFHMPPLSLWNSRTNRWSGPENFEIAQKLLMSRITGPLKSMEMIHANSSNLGCQWLDQRFGHAHFHVPIWINSSHICLRNTFPHLCNLSIYLPIYRSIYLSIHLSIYIIFMTIILMTTTIMIVPTVSSLSLFS